MTSLNTSYLYLIKLSIHWVWNHASTMKMILIAHTGQEVNNPSELWEWHTGYSFLGYGMEKSSSPLWYKLILNLEPLLDCFCKLTYLMPQPTLFFWENGVGWLDSLFCRSREPWPGFRKGKWELCDKGYSSDLPRTKGTWSNCLYYLEAAIPWNPLIAVVPQNREIRTPYDQPPY